MAAVPEWTLLAPGTAGDLSGGHVYNRRVCAELTALGTPVTLRHVPGRFPDTDAETETAAAALMQGLPEGSVVIVDGMAFSALPDLMLAQAHRLRLIALVHLPLADETGLSPETAERFRHQEERALTAASGVIATSAFCARRLLGYQVPPESIRSVPPGVDRPPAPPVRPTHEVPHLLCVANLIPRKGQHLLIEALSGLRELPWQCTLVGSLALAPDYVTRVRSAIAHHGLEARVRITDSLPHDQLPDYYRQADVFVLPSLFETYGMVVTEALAYGLPVVTTTAGALADTLPPGAGLSIAPNDVAALQAALHQVIGHPDERAQWAARAHATSADLVGWADTARQFRAAVQGFSAAHMPAPAHVSAQALEPHSGTEREFFSGDWLALREAADHRARAGELDRRLISALTARFGVAQRPSRPDRPLNVVDLGSGSGSNVRYLAPKLQSALPGTAQTWTLVDHDPELLTRAQAGCQHLPVTLLPFRADLRALDELQWPSGSVDLMTASALLDLVSADWASTLASVCRRHNCPVLITLSYDGRIEFSEPLPDDELVCTTVNAHQQGDGVFGPSLGPTAPQVLAEQLTGLGFDVHLRESPWRLDRKEAALQRALIRGWADACREQRPDLTPRFDRWEQARLAGTDNPDGRLLVGHLDLFALPVDGSARGALTHAE